VISEIRVVLPGAVPAEKDGELARGHIERNVGQRGASAEAVANALNGKRFHGATTMPQGERPTGIDFSGACRTRSITVTSLEFPFAV
jgi:hypothetical protein